MTAVLDLPRIVHVGEEWDALADELLPLMSPNAVAKVLGTKTGTLGCQRSLGTGPWFVKVGKSIFYPKECVLEWHYRQSGSRQHADPVFTALKAALKLGTGPWFVKVGKSIFYPKECVLEWHYRQSGSRQHADPVFTALKAALKPRNRPRELKVLCGISADVLATWRKDPDHPLHPIKDANHWEYSKERVLEFFAANLHRSTGEYANAAQEGEG